MTDDSKCCICLESLFSASAVLGVSTPCGHPIHEACFRGWERSKRGGDCYGNRMNASCPTCNQRNVTFTRVFISIPQENEIDDDDDDSSVSSVESLNDKDDAANSTKNKENNDEEGVENSEEEKNEASEKNDNNNSTPMDGGATNPSEIEIEDENTQDNAEDVVDLTASPERKASRKSKPTNKERSEEEQRLRRKNKKFKRRLKTCKQMYDSCREEKENLCKSNENLSKELNELKTEAMNMTETIDELRLDEQHTNLENVKLTRQLGESKAETARVQQLLDKTNEQFEVAKRQHEESVKAARNNISEEMKQIAAKYPKLEKKNQQLTEEVGRWEKKWANVKETIERKLSKRERGEIDALINDQEESSEQARKKRRNLKKDLKELAQARHEQHAISNVELKRMREAEVRAEKEKAMKKPIASGRAQAMVQRAQLSTKRKINNACPLDDILGPKRSKRQSNEAGQSGMKRSSTAITNNGYNPARQQSLLQESHQATSKRNDQLQNRHASISISTSSSASARRVSTSSHDNSPSFLAPPTLKLTKHNNPKARIQRQEYSKHIRGGRRLSGHADISSFMVRKP